ncbi:MAG: TetR/AcrR family transcriptional regulator [Sutterellaceae bacterium]|nr:TetR/AcrR family transcriptional regulator [Sutterellaceae bacterium]MDD7443005.1 TetR/AcrR family transcriptional regulator [Sutterellaceae bacterium]MDY2868240.1 TetR/AcrR family transcriptional regulator [Mesosutterella sp.]
MEDNSCAPGSRNRNTFILAAKPLFAARGFEGVTMRDIANRLGVTQAALYYHFRSKSELYLAVLEKAAAGPIQKIREAAGEKSSPSERMRAGILALLREFARDADLSRLLMRTVIDEDQDRGRVLGEKIFAEGFRFFRGEASALRPGLDPGETASAVIAACTFPYAASGLGTHLAGLSPTPPSPDALAAHLMRLFNFGD